MDISSILNKTKLDILLSKNNSYISSILCELDICVTEEVETAACCNTSISLNPIFFESLDEKSRCALLLHEVWHIARLHVLRCKDKHVSTWNTACDIVINNDLIKQGYDIANMHGYYDFDLDGLTEEEIYKVIFDNPPEDTKESDLLTDADDDPMSQRDAVNLVAKSINKLPGNTAFDSLRQYVSNAITPKLSWKKILHKYMLALSKDDEYSFNRPNRRYTDMYLPSIKVSESKLDKVCCYLDTSGSIDDKQITCFKDMVKNLKKEFNPKLLEVYTFDTHLYPTVTFTDTDRFKEFTVTGGGGTRYDDVQTNILQRHPDVAIIFTDLYADAMGPVRNIPVVWLVPPYHSNKVPDVGTKIEIEYES